MFVEAYNSNSEKLPRLSLNDHLTDKHGDPTVRTYNGETPNEFGLEGESFVLYWEDKYWCPGKFKHINKGDHWRKMPPAPKD